MFSVLRWSHKKNIRIYPISGPSSNVLALRPTI
jgi:16S rRNA C1402 (ribose-2'-O) methylase RsmI